MSGLFDALFPRGPALERVLLRTGAGRVLCYRDALEASARIAHALRGLGVRPGDRVAVQVEKSPEAVLLYLACLRLGAVYLPLNPLYTPAEIEYLLADSMPALFVCAPGRGAELAPLAQRLGVPAVVTLGAGEGAAAAPGSLMEAAGACPAQFATVARAAQDPAAILYTSGTTGRPKGAMLTQGNLLSNARTLAELWDFSGADVLLHALPIFHVHGLFVAINVTLAAGSSMIFLPRFEVAEVLRQLDAATVLLGVPTFYVRLLADPRLNPGLTARCRLFISGSAPLLPETHRAWRERTGHALLERYGMTETGMISSNPLQGERRAGSVGLALPGVQVRITDPASGAPLGTEAVGLIEVRGPNVFAGYWRAPEQTRAEFRGDGFFMTGDLGRIDARGYLWIVGRARDLIISGGYNVYPKEVEQQLDALPGVRESAVFGVPHPEFGEAVAAVVVPDEEARSAPEQAALLQALRPRLAAYKLPKCVIVIAELPRNSMGKVQKALLRQRYASLFEFVGTAGGGYDAAAAGPAGCGDEDA